VAGLASLLLTRWSGELGPTPLAKAPHFFTHSIVPSLFFLSGFRRASVPQSMPLEYPVHGTEVLAER
jgi:hypothetical protein